GAPARVFTRLRQVAATAARPDLNGFMVTSFDGNEAATHLLPAYLTLVPPREAASCLPFRTCRQPNLARNSGRWRRFRRRSTTLRKPNPGEERRSTGLDANQDRTWFGESAPSCPNRSTGHVWSEGRAGSGTDAQEPSLRNSWKESCDISHWRPQVLEHLR